MNRQPSDDRMLVKRLQEDDPTAVQDLVSAYGSKIYQLSFRYMKNREDAEEVSQDVLLKVHRKIKEFRGDAALSSWIYRITFNTAMSRLRTVRFSRPAEVSERAATRGDLDERVTLKSEPADWSNIPDEALLRAELRERLASALDELPPIYRTPIVLRDIEGLSTEEASARLNVKTQTLKSRLHRGRLVLRNQLSDFANGLSLHPAA